MRMLHKVYSCQIPSFSCTYEVSAWMAPGSKTVNYLVKDRRGMLSEVFSEVLGKGANLNISTMDELIDYLYYVVKA